MNYEPRKSRFIVDGFSVLDTIRFLEIATKKSQARLLSTLETLIDDPEKYSIARKAVLDVTNEFTRDAVKNIFGEID